MIMDRRAFAHGARCCTTVRPKHFLLTEDRAMKWRSVFRAAGSNASQKQG